MSQHQLPPDAKDVEALLLSDIFMSDDQTCVPDAASREVSLRGDLEQMQLADIFQSLGMAQMEGVLRVRNLVECREIYFSEGKVRSYIPSRVEMRRLGIQLVQAGLVTPAQLRSMLLELRRDGRQLQDLLIANEVLPEEDVHGLFQHQAGEDIYSLFAWRSGAFEFYKGPPSDDAARQKLAAAPVFEINTVLMEAARRSDEWEVIQERLRSIDELLVHGSRAPDDLSGDDREVYLAVDGQRPVRVLSQSMLIGLFEACRIVANLLDQGYLRFATVEEGLAVAQHLVESGQKKLAVALLQTLAGRTTECGPTELQAIAEVLSKADSGRIAAGILIGAASSLDDPSVSIPLVRRALALQPRSIEALERLRTLLQQHPAHASRNELQQLADVLVDLLLAAERHDDALAALLELDHLAPGDPRTAFRRAVVLHRAGRKDDAIASLMGLVETFKAQRNREQLAAVYDQILKIDSHRRDIQKARRALRRSAAVRRVRVAAAAIVTLGLGSAGVAVYRGVQERRAVETAEEVVNQALHGGDAAAAMRAVDALQEQAGETEAVESLRGRVNGHLAKAREAERRAAEATRDAVLKQASERVDAGDVVGAISAYRQLATSGEPGAASSATQAVQARFETLHAELEALAARLPDKVPPPPDSLQTAAVRRQTLEQLAADFPARERERVQALRGALDSDLTTGLLTPALVEKLRAVCATIDGQFGVAEARRAEYSSAESRLESARRLQPLLVEAREHEAAFRFRQALDTYRILAKEHTGEDQLRAMFLDRVEANATIVRLLELLEQATQAGDFAAAQGQLRAMRKARPEVPFDRLVRLPLLVTSVPSGASVFAADGTTPLGVTPLRTSYTPGGVTALRIELAGYGPESTTVSGDNVGEVRSTLCKRPQWSVEFTGPVTQSPATQAQRTFVVDRSGVLTALDEVSGRQLWQLRTDDLSGFLPRPACFDQVVVVASLDGPLRCVDARDGKVSWERDELGTEVGPVIANGVVIVATNDSRLVGLDVTNGRPRFERPLTHGATAAMLLVDTRVYVIAASGHLVCANAQDGRELWHAAFEQLVTAAPITVDNLLVVVGDEGRAAAYDAHTGRLAWSEEFPLLASVSPIALGGTVFVATDNQVLGLDPATGNRRTRIPVTERVSMLAALGERLLIGSDQGEINVLDPANGALKTRLRGPGRATVATPGVAGGILIGFEGRTVHAYRDLP